MNLHLGGCAISNVTLCANSTYSLFSQSHRKKRTPRFWARRTRCVCHCSLCQPTLCTFNLVALRSKFEISSTRTFSNIALITIIASDNPRFISGINNFRTIKALSKLITHELVFFISAFDYTIIKNHLIYVSCDLYRNRIPTYILCLCNLTLSVVFLTNVYF